MYKKSNLSKWLEKGLNYMKNEKAYCINIIDEGDEWNCELVGTDKFLQDDNDWFFDETKVFSREKPFVIINKNDNGHYQEFLDIFSKQLQEILIENQSIKNIVCGKTFAYGFIDGKLNFIETIECEKD